MGSAVSVLKFFADFVELLIMWILEVTLGDLLEVKRRARFVGMEAA